MALRFDMVDFVAYDVHVLKRHGAANEYAPALVDEAHRRLTSMTEQAIADLEHNIIAGLPGREETHTLESIRQSISAFDGIGSSEMRDNLVAFLNEIVPVAEEFGIRLGIHPDDPPFPLFGLPRVVSTAADARFILNAVDHVANGLTLCAGSYGSRPDNDLTAMADEFGSRIHFTHLRNVAREADGSFMESDHLGGNVNMVRLISSLMREERRRAAIGDHHVIPMRPDHGHLLLDDIDKTVNPGYSCIGRLKGLAELRGVMAAVGQMMSD